MCIRASVVAASVLLLSACGGDAAPEGGDAPPPAPAANAATAPDLFVESAADDGELVFVGSDSAIVGGRTDAVFVPYTTFSVERDGIPNEFPPADSMRTLLERAGLAGDRFVIVGEPIPAGRAFAALDYLGLGDRAALLDGGFAALDDAVPSGQPAEPAATPRTSGQGLDGSVNDAMIVDAAWVHERLDDPAVAILDARPPAEFSGATPGDGIERPGHIPGARNVFWQTLVESGERPYLKDEGELRRIFEEAGAEPGDTIVAYCRTGGQASFLYTVARHLGYDVRLYDGSYIDWSRTDYAVER